MNKAILIGRVGKEPDVKTMQNSNMVANFSIATSESYKDKATGEKKEITDWHNIVIWGKLAEVVQKYVHKGDLICVVGKMRTRSWEKDGITRYVTEVIVDEMKMLGSKGQSSGGSSSGQSAPAAESGGKQESFTDVGGSDDLPF